MRAMQMPKTYPSHPGRSTHPPSSNVTSAVRAGAIRYDRSRHLPALIRADPAGLAAKTALEATNMIIARLDRALRSERARARSGHWTYDLNRHIALLQAHQAESEELARLKRAAAAAPS